MQSIKLRCALVLGFLAAPAGVAAQCIECTQNTQAAYLGAVTRSNAMNKAYGSRQQAAKSRSNSYSVASPTAFSARSFTPPNREGASIRFSYQPSPAVRREAQAALLQRLQSNNPDAARALGEQLRSNDFSKIYSGLTSPFGLRDDDAADVLAAYTALGYLIATGAPDPSPAAVRSLRNQIAPKLAANAQLNAPGARASLAEELKLLFVTLHAGWQGARRDGSLRQYSDATAQVFKGQGTDMRALRLTNAGFVAR
ncbi:MAG: hypothetical protein H7X91_11395 [Burkholderiales bacterium]|nr:hypothetical protein [Burkholderiales bacterium]